MKLSLDALYTYYQVKNDTLFIYDGYFPTETDLGVPVVITSNMKVSEVMKIESDYLNNPDTDFKLFPESHKEILIKAAYHIRQRQSVPKISTSFFPHVISIYILTHENLKAQYFYSHLQNE